MMRRRSEGLLDLVLVGAATLVSLALIALPGDGLLKALALVPMVLFLPGYAITAAMFPPGRLPRGERFAYSITASVGAAALGGLFWQIPFELSQGSWALILATITLAASGVALRRRPSAQLPRATLPHLDMPTTLFALVAVALSVLAVGVAIDGVHDQRAEHHFSGLWVVPRDGGRRGFEVGVLNHQGATQSYRLAVTGAGRTIRDWEGRLGSRELKQLILPAAIVPNDARLVVSLTKEGTPYRSTELQTGPEA
jgi:hypothetical protein